MAKRPRFPDGTPKIPKQKCLECGYLCDAASETERSKRPPKPGDISLCLNCGAAMQFDRQYRFKKISRKEWRLIGEDDAAMQLIIKARMFCARARGEDLTLR
jgi:hypothetical protein